MTTIAGFEAIACTQINRFGSLPSKVAVPGGAVQLVRLTTQFRTFYGLAGGSCR
jgi:hypothetical protein